MKQKCDPGWEHLREEATRDWSHCWRGPNGARNKVLHLIPTPLSKTEHLILAFVRGGKESEALLG